MKTILDHHYKILACVFLLALPALFFSMRIRLDSSTEIFFADGDPAKEVYDQFKREFGSDEYLFVLIQAPIEKTLDSPLYGEISKRLKQIQGVEGVYNPLEKYAEIVTATEGRLDVQKMKEMVEGNPFEKKGGFLSLDKNYLAFALKIKAASSAQRGDIFHDAEKVLVQCGVDMKSVKIAGQPVLNHFLSETPEEAVAVFFPLLFIISVAVLFYLFRDIRLVAAPMILILFTEIFMMGFIGYMGSDLNIVNSITPVILYIITLAAAIHLLEHLASHPMAEGRLEEGLLQTMREKFAPCLFANFTTAVGFGSFALSPLGPIKSLGVYLFIGCFISLFLLFSVFPALLLVLLKKGPSTTRVDLDGFFRHMASGVRKWRAAILLLAVVPVAYALLHCQDVHFQTNGLYYFKQDSFIRQNTSFLEEAGLPLTSIEMVIEGEENELKSAKILDDIYAFGVDLEKINGVRRAYSVASLLAELHGLKFRAFRPPPDFLVGVYFQTLLEKNPEVLRSFVNPTFSKARITLGLPTIDYEEFRQIKLEVEKAFYRSPLSRKMKMAVTGQFPLILSAQSYLLETLFKSFGSSFLVILICFFLLLKDLSLGLLAVIPNLFPIFCAFCLMFTLGLDFDVANVMVASVILGIAVDETGHFLCHLKSISWKEDISGAVYLGYRKTGGAIIFTSMVLSLGFLVFAFSQFIPTRNFGILSSFSFLAALIGNLLILPALLFCFRKGEEVKGERLKAEG
ncbi:MAG: MMPL family transporter [Nitrospinae bacterium]|nr:MMPL family transporter [Nitrospinota bacterium]